MKMLKISLSLMSMGLFLMSLAHDDKKEKNCSTCCERCTSQKKDLSDPFFDDIDSFLNEFDKRQLQLEQIAVESEFMPHLENAGSLWKDEKTAGLSDPHISRLQKHQRREAHAKIKQQGSIPSNSKIQKREMAFNDEKPRPGVPIVQNEKKKDIEDKSQPLKAILEPSPMIASASNMDKKMESSSSSKDYGMPGYNMPELSINRRGANAIISGSFIYWKVDQDDFDVGIRGARPYSEQKVESFHSTYEPGFKAELGVNSSYDNWTLCLEYTWLKAQQTNARGSNDKYPMIVSPWVSLTENDQKLYTPFSATSSEILHSGARNHWRFHFDMLDLALSRSYYVGKKLIFNPFLAARGAKINQNLNVTFTYNTQVSAHTENTIYSTNKNHTQQIGPRFGLDMSWLIGSSFRFGGLAAGSLLYTHYQLRHTETLNGNSHSNIYANPHAFRVNLDAALEFGWRAYVSRHRRYIDCSFKYEALVFFDQNRVAGLASITTDQGRVLDSGNLYLHGATFKLEFNF